MLDDIFSFLSILPSSISFLNVSTLSSICFTSSSVAFLIALWSLAPIDIVLKRFFVEAPNSNGTALLWPQWSFAIFVGVFLGLAALLNYYLAAFWPLIVALVLGLVVYFINMIWTLKVITES